MVTPSGKGGLATITVNGEKVASGRIERTQCCAYSADEGADVGADEGTPVSDQYESPFKFTGRIHSITIAYQEMQKTDAEEAEKARKASAMKKGMSD